VTGTAQAFEVFDDVDHTDSDEEGGREKGREGGRL
jgi:hypothetical protein